MADVGSENRREIWRKFLSKHWKVLVLFVVGAILVATGAILVFVWFVGDAQSTGLVPAALSLWTMGNLVTFIIQLILWEVLLVGVPTGLGAIAGYLWWRRLPSEEKKEYHFFSKRSRTTSGGGSISFLIFIAFCIKVYADGNWNVPIATWTFNYLVYAYLTTLLWILIIFGIPASLALIWWINHEMKKKP